MQEVKVSVEEKLKKRFAQPINPGIRISNAMKNISVFAPLLLPHK
jgi:hypothetical protein